MKAPYHQPLRHEEEDCSQHPQNQGHRTCLGRRGQVSQAEHGHEVHQNEVAELERPDKLDRLRGGLCRLRSHKLRKKRLRINAQGWAPFSLKGGKMNRFKLPGGEEDWRARISDRSLGRLEDHFFDVLNFPPASNFAAISL